LPALTDLLLIAYKLAILTFYIGVLIYALPIPWRGIKRWGPTLIIDGILTAGFVLIFHLLFELTDFLIGLLGGSWYFFHIWTFKILAWVVTVKTTLITIKLVLTGVGLSSLYSSFIAPLDKTLDAVYVTAAWYLGMGKLILDYGKYLAGLGAALYAVPFRIARSAGAWLIAFVLVFSVGLPVMPSFIAYMSELPEPPDVGPIQELGITVAKVEVHDAIGNNVVYGIADIVNDKYGLVARYKILGSLVYSDRTEYTIIVPSRKPVTYQIVVNGVRFTAQPNPVTPLDYKDRDDIWRLNLEVPNLVWIVRNTIFYTNGYIEDATISGNISVVVAVINVYLERGWAAEVNYASHCSNVEVKAPGLRQSTYTWYWAGLDGKAIKLVADSPGVYTITVIVRDCYLRLPDELPSTIDMFNNKNLGWNFIDFDVIALLLVYYVTIPIMYAFLLVVVTHGVARLLGGRDRFVPKF